jgi:hypothetical protein
MRCFSEDLNDWYKSELRNQKIELIMMNITKLIITKNGRHHFRKVKHLRNVGVFIVEQDGDVTMFHDKKVIPDYGSLVDIIEDLCKQKVRDSKIERLLK